MVIVFNSMSAEDLKLGCGEKETSFIENNSMVLQHGWENSMAVEKLSVFTGE